MSMSAGDDESATGMTRVVADLAEADCAERIFAAAEGLPPVRLLVNNAARFAGDSVEAFRPPNSTRIWRSMCARRRC